MIKQLYCIFENLTMKSWKYLFLIGTSKARTASRGGIEEQPAGSEQQARRHQQEGLITAG
jgi:hypothetical protein